MADKKEYHDGQGIADRELRKFGQNNDGEVIVKTVQSDDPWSHNATAMTAWYQPKVVIDKSLFHGIWTFDIPTESWRVKENGAYLTTNVNNSVNITVVDSKLTITAGATLDDVSFTKSKRSPRYQPNRGHLYSTALGLPSPTALGIRDFGLFTEDNGVYFRLKSDGNLYACIDSGGVNIKEELIEVPSTIDVELGNVYDINMQWRGVGNYRFFINLVEVHAINFLGTLDNKLSLENPALPVCYRATNLGDNVSMWVGCVDITSEGGGDENLVYGSIPHYEDLTSTSEIAFFVLKINETFNGKINTRDIILDRITTSCNNESEVRVMATIDPTVLTGTVWSNYKGRDNIQYAGMSDIVVDLASSSITPIMHTRIEQDLKNEMTNPSTRNPFYLTAGAFLIVTAKASNGNKFYSTVEFTEEV